MTDALHSYPRYHQLPVDPSKPPYSTWGLFGEKDQIGTVNLLTPCLLYTSDAADE